MSPMNWHFYVMNSVVSYHCRKCVTKLLPRELCRKPIAAGNMQKSVIQRTTNVNRTLFLYSLLSIVSISCFELTRVQNNDTYFGEGVVECVIEIDRSSLYGVTDFH